MTILLREPQLPAERKYILDHKFIFHRANGSHVTLRGLDSSYQFVSELLGEPEKKIKLGKCWTMVSCFHTLTVFMMRIDSSLSLRGREKDLSAEEKWICYLTNGSSNASFDKEIALKWVPWLKWEDANRTCTCACGHVKNTSASAFYQNLGPHVVSNMSSHSEVAILSVFGVFELSEH